MSETGYLQNETRPAELTDEQITALIADPAKIETHEIALEIIGCLDAEIANIQVQIDAATIEANIRPLSAERQAWLRRASYAAAMRRQERHKVMQRDKEIRGTKGKAFTEPKRNKEEGLLKQQRLMAEAEARRDKRRAEVLALENQKASIANTRREMELKMSFNRRFHDAAERLLPKETYDQICDAVGV